MSTKPLFILVTLHNVQILRVSYCILAATLYPTFSLGITLFKVVT